jgi:hypothetical protein
MLSEADPEGDRMTIPTDGPDREPRRGNPLRAVSDAVVSPELALPNPYAAAALAVGIIALLFDAYGVLPAIGVVVGVLGLIRSGRLTRAGGTRTGRGRSIAGLVLSLLGLLRLVPAVAHLLPGAIPGT